MKLAKTTLIIWVFFWILFVVRGLYKGEFREYRALLQRDAETKRAYIVGEDLYEFLNFCLMNLPRESSYQLRGELKSIDERRLVYYLYPHKKSDNPEYLLCYNDDRDIVRKSFYKSAVFKTGHFILRRRAD